MKEAFQPFPKSESLFSSQWFLFPASWRSKRVLELPFPPFNRERTKFPFLTNTSVNLSSAALKGSASFAYSRIAWISRYQVSRNFFFFLNLANVARDNLIRSKLNAIKSAINNLNRFSSNRSKTCFIYLVSIFIPSPSDYRTFPSTRWHSNRLQQAAPPGFTNALLRAFSFPFLFFLFFSLSSIPRKLCPPSNLFFYSPFLYTSLLLSPPGPTKVVTFKIYRTYWKSINCNGIKKFRRKVFNLLLSPSLFSDFRIFRELRFPSERAKFVRLEICLRVFLLHYTKSYELCTKIAPR